MNGKTEDPLNRAEGMVYGATLQLGFESEAFKKEFDGMVEEIHRLSKRIDEIAADPTFTPHKRIERVNSAVTATVPNLNMTTLFMRAHDLERAETYLKQEQEKLAALKRTTEVVKK